MFLISPARATMSWRKSLPPPPAEVTNPTSRSWSSSPGLTSPPRSTASRRTTPPPREKDTFFHKKERTSERKKERKMLRKESWLHVRMIWSISGGCSSGSFCVCDIAEWGKKEEKDFRENASLEGRRLRPRELFDLWKKNTCHQFVLQPLFS